MSGWLVVLAVLAGAPQAEALTQAPVGAWTTYVADGGGGRVSYLRFAVVAEQRDGLGREAVWLELEIGLDPGLASPIARLAALAAREEGLTPDGVTRLILAVGTGEPVELRPEELHRFWPSSPARLPRIDSLPAGLTVHSVARTISTPRGALSSRCAETRRGPLVVHSVCVAEAVPILGVVELSLPGAGQSLRVQAWGTAASRRMPVVASAPSIPGAQ